MRQAPLIWKVQLNGNDDTCYVREVVRALASQPTSPVLDITIPLGSTLTQSRVPSYLCTSDSATKKHTWHHVRQLLVSQLLHSVSCLAAVSFSFLQTCKRLFGVLEVLHLDVMAP